jgi:putative SOS response-associated peptidase YedK
MCGRYVAAQDPQALVEEFDVDDAVPEVLAPDFNMAPTKRAYLVARSESSEHPTRTLAVARWGLVPSWAKDPSIGARLINARCETVAEKPSFRSAFARRRCLVPADGYYEWRGERGAKQPFYLSAADGSVLAMAGIFEWWVDRGRAPEDPQARWLTFAILTRDAVGPAADIHDRMPVMVQSTHRGAWLDPGTDAQRALADCTAPNLVAVPVSTAVNNVRNNGPDLIRPMASG